MNNYYTGIGSRETPKDILELMEKIALKLKEGGLTLRSGGAPGADTYFHKGASSSADIYLPWNGFNSCWENQSTAFKDVSNYTNKEMACEIAGKIHPAWGNCNRVVRKFHTRNVYQILGADLRQPSRFVIYWAPEKDGKISGGTATAVNLAKKENIQTFNLLFEENRNRVTNFIGL